MCKPLGRLNRCLKRVSVILGRPASILYAALYLLAIPLFALVYFQSPGDFYHSSLMHEASLQADGDVIAHQLKDVLTGGHKGGARRQRVSSHGWVADLGEAHVYHAQYEAKKISVRLAVPLRKAGEAEAKFSRLFILSIDPVPQSVVILEPREHAVLIAVSADPPRQGEFDVMDLFENPVEWNPGEAWVFVPEELSLRLQDYASAHEGRPGATNAMGYPRMLYLSVVTITTLGFGDIVPITPWSRFWVGLEAVSGVVLIGLFLNALAQEISAGK